MRELNKIAEDLFEKIRGRFEDVSLGDENAKSTQNPESARFFNFDYEVDGRNHGNITISIIDEQSLKVYFSKNISRDLDESEQKKWYQFLRELRQFAKRNLLTFEPRDITRSTLKIRDIKQISKDDSTYSKKDADHLGESRMYGTLNRSYESFGPVRIKLVHSKPVVDEANGARSRNIQSIYVENDSYERFKLPFNSLTGARAMARHISAGGLPTDELGQHITEMVNEMMSLRPFVNQMRHRTFEDATTQAMIESAFGYHRMLKQTLGKLKGKKGYTEYKDNYQPALIEDDADVDDLKEKFVKKIYDDRISNALPVVHKAYNIMKDYAPKETSAFESWATRLSEGTWAVPETEEDKNELAELLSNPLPAGVDGENATGALYNLIGDDRLFDEIADVAQEDPNYDVRELVTVWLEENMPEIYQWLLSNIGDDPNYPVEEGWNTGSDRVSLPDTPHTYWSGNGALQQEYNDLYEKLVPAQGAADTIEGEVLRAASKIVYRHYNDGDEFNQASFDQLEPYIGKVSSYDDLAHKAIEFALKANGNYHPNPGWDSLDVMDYGPEDYDDEDDDWEDDDYDDEEAEEVDESISVGKAEVAEDMGDDQTREIADMILHRIKVNIKDHAELFRKLGPDGVMDAAEEVANFYSPMEEIGSSDIGAMIRSVYRYAGLEYKMNENERAIPGDSTASPLTHTDSADAYCDACDRVEKECVCEEVDLEVQLAEDWKKWAAGAALAGALGANAYLDKQSHEGSAQLKQLQAYHQMAVQKGDKAKAKELEQRIADHKARLELGKGDVMGADGQPKKVQYEEDKVKEGTFRDEDGSEDEDDLAKDVEALKKIGAVRESEKELAEMKRLAGLA